MANNKKDFFYLKVNKNFFGEYNRKETSVDNINLNDSTLSINQTNNNVDEKDEKLKMIEELVQLKNNYEKLKKNNPLNKKYIETLHNYNEAKDMAQEILGSLAENKCILVKTLYEEMGISDDEKR